MLGVATCLSGALSARPAQAQEFQLHVEPAAAFWVDQPQSDRFDPGFYLAVRPGIALGSVVSLQWSYAFLAVPAGKDFTEAGAAHFLTAGVRLRPLGTLQADEHQLGGLFTDFNVGYVRTGQLDRMGLDVGLGYDFQPLSWMALGPVVRYVQIVQPDRILNANPNDAQFLTVGLDFGFGRAHHEDADEDEDKDDVTCPEAPACPKVEQPLAVPLAVLDEDSCPDGDRDGVCDDYDHCPTVIGPLTTLGCPIDPCGGDPLVVLVQFDQDSTSLPVPRAGDTQTMDPVLDAVAQAIAQDPSCRVCITGYASEEGAADYNMDLSRRRATSVERYLHARGLADDRMPTTGMGEQCQLDPLASRVLNRRVEFRRLQEGESCPVDCSENK